MSSVSTRVLRSTAALRPSILSRPVVGSQGFHVSSRLRQTTEPPRPATPNKNPEGPSQGQ